LTSTVAGIIANNLGGGGITSANSVSTVAGLGSSSYVSTLSLTSTVAGIIANNLGGGGITSANSVSTVAGLGSLGYISSVILTSTTQEYLVSTVAGLGSSKYISSASLNNGIFTLSVPPSIYNNINVNSAANSFKVVSQYLGALNIKSVESYNTVFFSCKANISDNTGTTKFGLIDNTGNFINYFVNSIDFIGLVAYAGGGATFFPYNRYLNSNDVLSISITNFGSSQSVSFYINGTVFNTTNTNYTNPVYSAAFNYFNTGDTYTNIVFSGSYGNQPISTTAFLASYPYVQSPTYSTIQLIDTNNSSNILQLSNYISTIYFN
jgi:hypothetical protein